MIGYLWLGMDGLNGFLNLLTVVSLLVAVFSVLYTTLTGDAVHHAVAKGNSLVINRVLKAGKGLNAKGRSLLYRGRTPLHVAVMNTHPGMLKLLLEHGADPNIPDSSGMTPLLLAVLNGRDQQALQLLNHGADVNYAVETGGRRITALTLALDKRSWNMVRLMVDRDADLDAVGMQGDTVLHCLAQWNDVLLTELVLARGADVNARNDDGQQPLHIAVKAGHLELAEMLAVAGADVVSRGSDGRTPIEVLEQRRT